MLAQTCLRALLLLSTTVTLAIARPVETKTQPVSDSPLTYIGQKCKHRKDSDHIVTEDEVILNEIRQQSEITQQLGRLHVEKFYKQGHSSFARSLSGQSLAEAWVRYLALCQENWETFRLDISAWRQWTKDSLKDIGNTGRGFVSQLKDNYAGPTIGSRKDGGSNAENSAEPSFRMIQEMTIPVTYVLLMLIVASCFMHKLLKTCDTAKTAVLLKQDLDDEDEKLLHGGTDFEIITIPHSKTDFDYTVNQEGSGRRSLGRGDDIPMIS